MSFWKPGQQAPAAPAPAPAPVAAAAETNKSPNGTSSKGLSTNVMNMRFMKRKADAEQAAVDEAEKRRKLLNADWSDGQRDGGGGGGSDGVAMSVVDPASAIGSSSGSGSSSSCGSSSNSSSSSSSSGSSSSRSGAGWYEREDGDMMSALPGRRSFGGFNKAMERHYSEVMDEKRFNAAASSSSGGANAVSDQEMLARYQNLVGLPRGPNQGMKPKGKGKGGREDGSNHAKDGGKMLKPKAPPTTRRRQE